jgi:deglycase
MQERRLDGMRVAILVSTNFEQAEMTEPRRALDEAGARAILISTEQGQTRGFQHDHAGDSFSADMPLDSANPDDFDALMLPGGALNADHLRVVAKAQAFARRMDETNRPIAFICHAPWLLVSSGLVHGRTLTSYHTIRDDICNAGGHWLDQELVRDGNWVSSRSPKDLPAFNQGMIDLFAEFFHASRRRGDAKQATAASRNGS